MKNKENIFMVGGFIISVVIYGLFIYFAINLSRNKITYTEAYCGSSYAIRIEEIEIGNDYYLIKKPDGTYYRLSKDMCVLSGYQSE